MNLILFPFLKYHKIFISKETTNYLFRDFDKWYRQYLTLFLTERSVKTK